MRRLQPHLSWRGEGGGRKGVGGQRGRGGGGGGGGGGKKGGRTSLQYPTVLMELWVHTIPLPLEFPARGGPHAG